MLEVTNLSKKYGKTLAVDNVSFTVPDGGVGILLGPNGAGKSTVINFDGCDHRGSAPEVYRSIL